MRENIIERIRNIDCNICKVLDQAKDNEIGVTSSSMLQEARNLVEHVAMLIYCNDTGKEYASPYELYDYIKKSLSHLNTQSKYFFLRDYHKLLQQSVSHYTPNKDDAERLMFKYIKHFWQIKQFLYDNYSITILHNLNEYPLIIDKTLKEYYEQLTYKILKHTNDIVFNFNSRFYIEKVDMFNVNGRSYYEYTIIPAINSYSKLDRIIAYSNKYYPTNHSMKAVVYQDTVTVNEIEMTVYIIEQFQISIRPCEFENLAKIFNMNISISSDSTEYKAINSYLSNTHLSLLDILEASEIQFQNFVSLIHARRNTIIPLLLKAREIIISYLPGCNIIRYLLSHLRNTIIKGQSSNSPCNKLSGLYLSYGCIPFDEMPYATSLINHNPSFNDLIRCISTQNREHELFANAIQSYSISNNMIFVPKDELKDYHDHDNLIMKYNGRLYYKHKPSRCIEKAGEYYYINENFSNTQFIISKLLEYSQIGLQQYTSFASQWLKSNKLDSDEKIRIITSLFSDSKVAVIYGSAGTGKTYLIDCIARMYSTNTKLLLANTHPAKENLKINVDAANCQFETIAKVISKADNYTVDFLIIDECGMVTAKDMASVLCRVTAKVILLAGDIHQIEPIGFGNWFTLLTRFFQKKSWCELEDTRRTKERELLDLWNTVRENSDNITEYLSQTIRRYSTDLDSTIFKPLSSDEIILCLSYGGIYGINNINRYLQNNNPNPEIMCGIFKFKINDPILFNESQRFSSILYNNLKGRILDIQRESFSEFDRIWFSIEVDCVINVLDVVEYSDLQLLPAKNSNKSVVRFEVDFSHDSDKELNSREAQLPFQLAYAVSIHKAQGLEYESVKVVISEESDHQIDKHLFYTAITRTKKHLKIYWTAKSQEQILSNFANNDIGNDVNIFSALTKIKSYKRKK